MTICPHARDMRLPCPYPDCAAGVFGVRLTVPVVRHMGTMFVRPAIAHEHYTLVVDVQMGGPLHGAKTYGWMRDTLRDGDVRH